MSNILEQANEIVNKRSEEKERAYGPFSEGMERAAMIMRGMTGKDITGEDMYAAQPIRDWAQTRGLYEKGDPKTQYIKLMEEAGELAKAILKNDDKEFVDAIGDCVVVLTNLAKLKGYTIEECINSAYNEIANRKGQMVGGTFVKESL